MCASVRRRRGRGGGPSAPWSLHQVVGDDVGSNHPFRTVNHRVLDRRLGQTKLVITFGGSVEGHGEVSEGSEEAGARRRTVSTMMLSGSR